MAGFTCGGYDAVWQNPISTKSTKGIDLTGHRSNRSKILFDLLCSAVHYMGQGLHPPNRFGKGGTLIS